MATYYIRVTGNDANAGTSAGASWRTIAKALGASGIASGDTLWIGAGIYRELVTISMTSPTVETIISGDVTGINTGDSGEVQWTTYLTNDITFPSTSSLLTLNARDFLTFSDILFIGGDADIINANSANSTDITLQRCGFISGGNLSGSTNSAINFLARSGNPSNLIIDSCIFLKSAKNTISAVLTKSASAEYDSNIIIKNCLFIGGTGYCIVVTASGASAFSGGGVKALNCTQIGSGIFMQINAASISSTNFPCSVYNCYLYNANVAALQANTLGQLIENYNIINSGATTRVNVSIGNNSISDGSYAPLFNTGHEYYSVGANLKPFGMPKSGSPLLGFGNQASSPTVDILNASRPSGFIKATSGTATAGAAKTITNSGASFGTNALAGYTIKIISGTGSGQTKSIASNTATVITVDGNWKTNPNNTSVYEIYLRATSSSGTATSGSTTTLTDSNAAWGTNSWTGFTLSIDGGTGSGQSLTVISNTATALTFATATAPDATSTYKLFRGASENVINAGVGCYEYGQSGVRETITVRTGSNSLSIAGSGYIDFAIPVNAVASTITIYARYDSAYSGTLPSMNIVNGTECGVANATVTHVGAANAWAQLSLTFTPTSTGIITVRLIGASTTPTGNSFYDDFAIS